MEMTATELLEGNTLYYQGEFFDPDLYKKILPMHEYAQIKVSDHSLYVGKILHAMLEMASLTASLALAIIPTITLCGAHYFALSVMTGVAWGLFSSSPLSEAQRKSLIERWNEKSTLIGVFYQANKIRPWIYEDFMLPSIFKISLYVMMKHFRFGYHVGPFLVTTAIAYKLGRWIDNCLCSLVEALAEKRREVLFSEQTHTLA